VHAIYLTTGQAAYRLGICKRTLLRAMRRGEITAAYQTPGGFFRFRYADVEAYAQRLTCGAEAAAPPGELQSQPGASDR
jgi:excisionase family DNA binding protein